MDVINSKKDMVGLTGILNQKYIKSDVQSEQAWNEMFADNKSEITKIDTNDMDKLLLELDNQSISLQNDSSSMYKNPREVDLTRNDVVSDSDFSSDSDLSDISNAISNVNSNANFINLNKINNKLDNKLNNKLNSNYNHQYSNNHNYNHHYSNNHNSSNAKTIYKYKDPEFNALTEEKIKREHIDKVFTDMIDPNEDFIQMEKQTEEDNKYILLDEIDTLKEDIKACGVKLDNISEVDTTSSLEEINNVHKHLLYKYNSATNWGFMEEMVELGADGVEWLLDGKKDWFGAKPNASGFKRNTKVELRKLRYKSSRAVSNVVQTSNMGLFPMLAFKLIPSLLMQIKANNEKKNALDESEIQEGLSNIGSFSL